MSLLRLVLLAVLVLLVAAPVRAQEQGEAPRSDSHRALEELLARLDTAEAGFTEEGLEQVAGVALEHLSVMATSGRRFQGMPEKFVGARLVLQIGNVLMHRYQRVEDARMIARSASSIYAGGSPDTGALMQEALTRTGRGLDRLAGERRLEVTREAAWRWTPLRVGVLGGLALLLLGAAGFVLRSRLTAPEGVTVVDAGLQRRAQSALSLGLRLLEEERPEEAMMYFQQVAALESTLRDSGQYFLALVSLQQDDVERTSTLVDEIDFERIESEEAYALGDALERRGQVHLARKVFEKVYIGDVAYRDVKDRLEKLREETAAYSEEDVAGVIAERILDPRYQDVRLLASGGMGFVFETRDRERDGERLALKVLSPFYANDEDVYIRFVHEARGVAALDHPSIIRIHDVFEKSLPYYSMEFHESPDLKQILEERGRLEPALVRTLGMQLCGALDAAHRAGVVHRDVKPSNVLLGEDDRITLLDFGIAQFEQGTRITLTGQVLGSPRYMAPEQFLGDEVDHRSDLYSAGLILYELLTGDLPADRQRREVLENFPRPDPARRFPEALVEVVMGALAHRPEDRYRDMEAMRGALEAC